MILISFLKLCFTTTQDSENNSSSGELMASKIINSKALQDFERALKKKNEKINIKGLSENIQNYLEYGVDATLYASQQDSSMIKMVIMKLLDQIEKSEYLCTTEDLKSRRKNLLSSLTTEMEIIDVAELDSSKKNGGQNTEIGNI